MIDMEREYTIDHRAVRLMIPDDVRIDLYLLPDDSGTHPREFDCYDERDVTAFESGQWEYVGVVAQVSYRGEILAEDSVWSVEHGYSPGWDANALHMTSARHIPPNTTIMGSNAWHVADTALSAALAARKWWQHFSPTNHALRQAQSALATLNDPED